MHIIYTIGNEIEKGRGKKEGGNRLKRAWKIVVIATGEEPLIKNSNKDGAKMRIIEIQIIPGEDIKVDENSAEIINESRVASLENYGHFYMPYIVQALIHKHELKTWFKEFKKKLHATDNITDRKANQFAAIYVAGKLAEIVYRDMDMPAMDPEELVMKYWNRCVISEPLVPQDIEALEMFYGKILTDINKFATKREVGKREDASNTVLYGFNVDEYIEVFKPIADGYLKEIEAEATTTYSSWRERKVTECSKNPTASKKASAPVYRPTHQVSIHDKSTNSYFENGMIRLNKRRIMELLDLTKREVKSLSDLYDLPPLSET
jgi:uncharacterized protein (DUF927 family)